MSTSLLKRVQRGTNIGPFKGLIHGHEKIGKSTFLNGAPAVLFADVEKRLSHIDCAKVAINSFDEMVGLAEELSKGGHPYKTLVVDSITVLEKMLKAKIADEEGWSEGDADEYGRWIKLAYNSHWPRFFALMERLQHEAGMTIWYVAHTAVRDMKEPKGGESYNRFRPDLGGNVGPQSWLHHADVVLFADWEDVIRVEGKPNTKQKVKTSTTGRRVAHTTHRPAFDAGNSYNLPEKIPLDYATFDRLRLESGKQVEVSVKQATELAAGLAEEKRVFALDYIKKHATSLPKIQGLIAKMQAAISEQEESEQAEPATAVGAETKKD